MKQNIPNILTGARIAGIPFIIVLMFIGTPLTHIWACGVYTVVCLTDFLDGYLSRKWQVISDLGRFLDPVADKLLVAAVLITLMIKGTLASASIEFGSIFGTVGGLIAMLILFREIAVSALREYLAERNIVVPVTRLAKWKTASQMVALGILVLGEQPNVIWGYSMYIGYVILVISGILTSMTGYAYIQGGIPHMLKDNRS